MADDDLGIIFKDKQKKSSDDDLGIVFKDEQPEEKSGILNDILQAGGTAGRAIGYGLADLIDTPVAAANYANQKVAGLFGVKPENVPTPDQFDPSAYPMPGVSKENEAQLDPLARVGTTAAEYAVPVFDAAKLATLSGKTALRLIQEKLGNAVEEKSNNFIDNLLHGKNLSEATEPVAQEIRGKYSGIQQGFGKEYNELKATAASRGYSPIISKQYPGISVATDQKAINAPNFKNDLSKLDLSKYSPDIKKSLDKFDENPSFSEAHDIQSALGREGNALKTNKDGSIRNLGNQLLNARKSLINDIHSSFAENGDNDLSQLYKDIGQRYKNQSAPYVANPTLRNIVFKKDIQEVNPTTIGNLLKKNDTATKIIRGDLSSQSKDLLLANEMKGAIKETPHSDGTLTREVDPEKLIDIYSKGDNKGISYLRNPDYNKSIASLINDLKKQKNISRIKSGLKWGAGLGAGALGLNEIRKYL
jgi:hypothetical protein